MLVSVEIIGFRASTPLKPLRATTSARKAIANIFQSWNSIERFIFLQDIVINIKPDSNDSASSGSEWEEKKIPQSVPLNCFEWKTWRNFRIRIEWKLNSHKSFSPSCRLGRPIPSTIIFAEPYVEPFMFPPLTRNSQQHSESGISMFALMQQQRTMCLTWKLSIFQSKH